ncbi:MAG TPA: glycosyltransferase family 4 protein [Gaiellaceae bacterium]|nr:glycosyltransferase family 4 protein [Gaiellaceae bacterium]
MTRVTLLTEIPAPYRIPLFNALAERVELTVLFLRERNPDRPYGLHADELRFKHRVLPGVDLTLRGRWIVLNRGVSRALRGADAVVLGGWNQPAFWTAVASCQARRVPAILWVESTDRDRRTGRLEPVKRMLLRGVAGYIVPGAAARAYVESLGVPPAHIEVAPNAVDPAIFGSAMRTRTTGPCRLVAVGRLALEKGIDTLLEATRGLPVEIVLVGIGPEETRLRELAGPNVTFLGHVGRDELPAVYADADVAVMPSRSDPWGMILNEAALAGLPLVSTTAAGAAHELIEDGVNGFRVAPDDPTALRAAIVRLVEDELFRRTAGRRSREIAECFTPEVWADAVAARVRNLVRR